MKKIFLLISLLSWIQPTYSQEKIQAIHVEVMGQGQPLLFIPGFSVPGEVWQPVAEKLSNSYECHIITLAGFGGTDPIGFPWLPQINKSLKSYILNSNFKDVKIVGHSLGGTISLWLASQKSLPISELLLVDALPAAGALMFPDFSPELLTYDSPYNLNQLQMTKEDFDHMVTNMALGMSLEKSGQEKIKEWMSEVDRQTYVYGYTDYLKLDMREGLKEIAIPVTILAADQPFGIERAGETYRSQYANLEKYQLIFAKESGHFIMLDQPEWFLLQLESLLQNK